MKGTNVYLQSIKNFDIKVYEIPINGDFNLYSSIILI